MEDTKEKKIKVAQGIAGVSLLAFVCIYMILLYNINESSWKQYCSTLVMYIWAGLAFSYGFYLVRQRKFVKGGILAVLSIAFPIFVEPYLSKIYYGNVSDLMAADGINLIYTMFAPLVCLGVVYWAEHVSRKICFRKRTEHQKLYLSSAVYIVAIGIVICCVQMWQDGFRISSSFWNIRNWDGSQVLLWLIIANVAYLKSYPQYFVKKKKCRCWHDGNHLKIAILNPGHRRYELFWNKPMKKGLTAEQVVRKTAIKIAVVVNAVILVLAVLYSEAVQSVLYSVKECIVTLGNPEFAKGEWMGNCLKSAAALVNGTCTFEELAQIEGIEETFAMIIAMKRVPLAAIRLFGGSGAAVGMIAIIVTTLISSVFIKYKEKAAQDISFYIKVSVFTAMLISILSQVSGVENVMPFPFLGNGAGNIMIVCIFMLLPLIFGEINTVEKEDSIAAMMEKRMLQSEGKRAVRNEESVLVTVEEDDTAAETQSEHENTSDMKFRNGENSEPISKEMESESQTIEIQSDEIESGDEETESEFMETQDEFEETEAETDAAESEVQSNDTEVQASTDEDEIEFEHAAEMFKRGMNQWFSRQVKLKYENREPEAEEDAAELSGFEAEELYVGEETWESEPREEIEQVNEVEAEPAMTDELESKFNFVKPKNKDKVETDEITQRMTPAYANKMIKNLEEEKDYWMSKEAASSTYTAAVHEEPVIPEYNYQEVANAIKKLDEKICVIKHALNLHNAAAKVTVGEQQMSVDMILIKMEQLNKRKQILDSMRKQLPKVRVTEQVYSGEITSAEYRYINYDLDLIKREYEAVSEQIMEMQMALDFYNQTVTFEVEW